MSTGSPYRYCPNCQAHVPVVRRFPKLVLFLFLLMALSLLGTALLYPRLILLFLFLPFGFGLWRRAEHCGVCGKRLPTAE